MVQSSVMFGDRGRKQLWFGAEKLRAARKTMHVSGA
jgi:hypothetical protein